MDDILKILKAPVKSWKTVVENICIRPSLRESIQEYSMCPGHMCFEPLLGNPEITRCSDCGSDEPLLSASTSVTYIPLLPRIQAMMNSEQSFRDLFSYHHSFEKKEGIYSDFFDSECYNRIASIYGGEDTVTWDIFIAASMDGFQAYKNRELAVWPVLVVLLNHGPSRRYSVKQILPLMFIPGGTQPTNLQSFLTPMINEINSTLPDGFPMKAFDGIERNVRLHLVWFTTDLDALTKVASLVDHNGKTPCRFCLIQGVYSSSSRHYYFPCSLLTQRSTTPTVRFDPASLPKRSGDSIAVAIQEAVTASTLAERKSLAKETGIKGDSILFNLPTMLPYHSFPPDIMHLFCNVQKHLLNIHTGGYDDLFSLSVKDVEVLDDEILAFSGGISGQMAPSPRKLSSFHNWKAAEHKVFSLSYYLILFDGYLPQRYLDGLDMFVQIADISFRPELTETDISDLSMASTEFIKHFEKFYMRFDPSRLKFSTYVMHLLPHLAEAIKENGPLVNCSQYWVERHIGWIVDRLKLSGFQPHHFETMPYSWSPTKFFLHQLQPSLTKTIQHV